ncbi:M16 family metallopeptidase [Piscinibacter gummiphilus]|uniref:Zinc protease n=1 Tax=Piscinibacter gummiphilus TaxID=946333 RepID=A0A1W6L7L6_9BURK|nr:pitrilysin family protein [Piscinibacter gummiphilus]ARN20319.1 zinc protease [Piscinibacter gummiphilus]ATU64991.1 insulinase family protein [Piscinibacter gummiphilus]GLS96369.1 peptidase M16 [Piscinibacter gummiphilus]
MLHRILSVAVGLTAALFIQTSSAQGLPAGVSQVRTVEGITEYRLANGLQVLLVPDDSKPTTTVNMTYHVGSRQENYGETGMAHLLEHLLFKGSKKHPTVWAEFTKRGLAANGSTWFDRTNYFASFASNEDNLRWYLGWQADAMVNSFIARKDLDTEMTVVRNEMEMGENNPQRILFEKTLATMYQWHNYGKNTIGARADVENVDIPRLQAFYRTYYQPDNATLIVSGKFDPEKVLRWIAADFRAIPKPTRKLPVQYTLDPVQDGERSVTLRRVGGVPLIFAGYHVPPGPSPDFAAVELLNLVMGDTPSGRLHKRLTEKQLAAATYAFAEGLAEPGFTLFGAQLAPGQDVDKARAAMLETLESVASEPVTDEEFKRAQAKWLNDWDQAFTNPEKVGVSLSESVAQGDWRLFFLQRDQVKALKREDVQRVATERLVTSNRTLGLYLPTEKPVRAPAPAKVDVAAELKTFKPQQAAKAVESFDATPANIDRRTERFEVGNLKVAVLPKGSRGNAVRAVMTLHFGDEKTLAGTNDLPSFVAELLDKGTATLSRQQVQDRLDALKTELSVSGSGGAVSIGLQTRREHLAEAVALVADLLRHPAFPEDALDELKRQSLASIEQNRREPGALASNTIARHGNPYPRGDVRYARTFDEMVQDIQGITNEKVKAFHQRFYGLQRAEFGAAGDIDVPALKAALQAGFGDWRGGEPYTRVPDPIVPIKPERFMVATPDKQNANFLARLEVPLTDMDADYPALSMANYLLGGGGNSRLWKRIRETEGLSYDVRTGVSWNTQEPNSAWTASAIFAPGNQPKVEVAFNDELAKALKDGFTAQELSEGKNGLLSFRRLSRAQDGVLASTLASNLHLGRTFEVSAKVDDALSKLTLQQVNDALRRYVKPDDLVKVFAGDFKKKP